MNSKKPDKFRQRAVALRRVSIVLLVLGLLMIILSVALWRDASHAPTTLENLNKSKLQHNYLSTYITILGFLLILQATAGLYTSGELELSFRLESSPESLSNSKGFYVSIAHMILTFTTFSVFIFCAIWFLFFNDGPASWFENHYYLKDAGRQHAIAQETKDSMDFIESNIQVYLVVLGLLCAVITFMLYISMQLMKKLMRRMERINTVVNIHCFMLSVFAVVMYYLLEITVNFDGVNAAPAIRNQVPWHYHERFLMLSAFLIFLSISSFVGSYLETPLIFSLNSMLTLVGILYCIMLLVITHQTASSVDLEISSGKCPFILP